MAAARTSTLRAFLTRKTENAYSITTAASITTAVGGKPVVGACGGGHAWLQSPATLPLGHGRSPWPVLFDCRYFQLDQTELLRRSWGKSFQLSAPSD
jgi:hypothetical protein